MRVSKGGVGVSAATILATIGGMVMSSPPQPREDFRDDAAERPEPEPMEAAASDRVDRKDMAERSLEERPCFV